ncbi:hypothetical protein ABH995_004481 [Bradyrhizobium yuanmingense]|uniref:hypothetical protein n=1 Tax=Bradyrhizobium yuanmingense TaxID=108015 RepID=UPI003513D10C
MFSMIVSRELAGPQQILLDLVARLRAYFDHPLTLAITGLVSRADELAQLDEIDLSGGIGGAAELLGEQAMHAHAITLRRVRASCRSFRRYASALS